LPYFCFRHAYSFLAAIAFDVGRCLIRRLHRSHGLRSASGRR
jgi:hypothetical protein